MAGHNRRTPAPRLNRKHSEQVVERIRLAQLVNLLQDNALGTLVDKDGDHYELSPGRIQSAWNTIRLRLAPVVAPTKVETRDMTLEALIRAAVTGQRPTFSQEAPELPPPEEEGIDVE